MRRYLYLLGFIICAALLGGAYYLQYVQHLEPCPLCIMQRVAYYLLGLICLIICLVNPQKAAAKIYNFLLIIFAVIGLFLAGRQVWLQHAPGDASGCAPNLQFMLNNFPLHQTVKVLFYGSGDCSLVKWDFLSLTLAEWSLLFFALFFIGAVILQFKKK